MIIEREAKSENGGLRMEDGGWRMEDGGCFLAALVAMTMQLWFRRRLLRHFVPRNEAINM